MLRDLRAAAVTGTLSVAYSISTSAIIFTGPIQKFLGLGLSAGLITAAFSAFITSLGSGFRIAIASPTSTIAAALAVTVAALDPVLDQLSDARAVPLVFAVLGLTTLATGAALLLIGYGQLGKIVRFIPFPVVAGFMGTSGWLLASGAVRLTTQVPFSVTSLSALSQPAKAMELALMIGWAGVLSFTSKHFKSPTITPCLLAGAVLAFNCIVSLKGGFGADDIWRDLTFRAGDHLATAMQPFANIFSEVDWPLIVPLLPSVLAVVFITVLTALFTCTGLESAFDLDGDVDREMKIQGVSNIASALGGGYIGLISVGTTMAAKAAGAQGRASGTLTGLICILALVSGVTLLNDVPRFVVGGLQLQIAVQVLWTWCIASRKKLPLSEWLLVIGIVAVAAWFGFVPAVLCGIFGGCLIFAIDASRINVIRRIYALNERGSALVRSATETAILSREGGSARIIELHGFIFFGSAYQMLNRVRSLVAEGGLRLLILDFSAVTGGDSSTAAVLGRLDKYLKREAVLLIFAGVSPQVLALLKSSGTIDLSSNILSDRNVALEFAETFVLAEADTPQPTSIPLVDWLAQSLGHRDLADLLVPMLEQKNVPAGTYLCRQGEPTDTLLFIETGRVSVMIGPEEKEVCVRIFGPHTIAGEQGFILKQPRTASLKVEQDARIWSLSRATYEYLLQTNSDLVIALMRDIVRVQSERLTFATRQNAALAG
jgi:SulP family sulfate permease